MTEWFPHGRCECLAHGRSCCGGRGPAAYEVQRGVLGRAHVCTRCIGVDLSTAWLLVRRGESLVPYEAHDLPGTYLLSLRLCRSA
jgi:hypothetical protein